MTHRSTGAFLATMVLAAAGCGGEAAPTEVVIPVYSQGAASGEYGTHMHGSEEVPARPTKATGQLVLKLSPDGSVLRYKLMVGNIEDVVQAHIHLAPRGVSGPVIAWLYPSAAPGVLIPGRSSGVLAEGEISDAGVVGPLAGQGIAGLIAAIEAGNAYANVHTLEFPPGAIRGQLD